MRTLLTLFGVAAAISMYVILASMSHGYKAQLDRTVSSSGVEIVVQAKRAATPLGSRIKSSSAETVARLAEVESSTPLKLGAMRLPNFPYTILVGIEGFERLDEVSRWFRSSIIAGKKGNPGPGEVFLGHIAAKRSKMWVGDVVQFDDKRSAKVVGIMTSGLDMLDGAILANLSEASSLLGDGDHYNMLLIKLREGHDPFAAMAKINEIDDTLAAFPANRLTDRLRAFTLVDSFIYAVAAASFILSSLLVLNTLVMSLSERTREIGILSAIGWSRGRITLMIVLEAVILCSAGGALGFALTYAELPLLSLIPGIGAGWMPAAPSFDTAPYAFLLSLAVGVASSLFPALYSTSLSPVAALRRE